jgi:hypothetical protein
MVHEQAFFRFNDGDFIGRPAVRAAFEKTWQGSASATYSWHWEGSMNGKSFGIRGRGTRVIIQQQGRLQIIHEHLSRFPAP